jgi:ribosomal protein S12 methylthiotransferase
MCSAPGVDGCAVAVAVDRRRKGADESVVVKRKVYFVTLGCPKNQVDTELMIGMLVQRGHEMVLDPAAADVLVVNTCSFIEDSKVESIDTILELARLKEGAKRRLIVTGCLPQRYADELQHELPEVDVFIGTGRLRAITTAVTVPLQEGRSFVYVGAGHTLAELERPRVVLGSFFSAYLRISEGCSRRCSFCVIPKVRGRHESRPLASLVSEATSLARQGVVELNLVAQDLTAYGQGRGDGNLADLLRALVRIEGIRWIRLLYVYPQRIDDELLDVIAGEEKVCQYIDMPLQHINTRVLRAMGRERSGASLSRLIARIRRRVPGVVLRTSFMVGFPGETEAEFGELVEFLKEAAIDHVGVFRYSREEGTPAAGLPDQVTAAVKMHRYRTLMEAQAQVSAERNASLVGRVQDVLVCEVGREGQPVGRTRGQAPGIDGAVVLDGGGAPGDIIPARIVGAGVYDLRGVMLACDTRVGDAVDNAGTSL